MSKDLKEQLLKMFEELADNYYGIMSSDYSCSQKDDEEYKNENLIRINNFKNLLDYCLKMQEGEND